jgi:4-carboxymuconolactone decarboxylase
VKSPVCLALCSTALAVSAQTSTPSGPLVEVRAAAASPVTIAPSENFTGVARISSPFEAKPPGRGGGATVSFEPGARTAWHTHPLGQTLIVTAGVGLVQQQGQAAQAIRPGDVVAIPPNVRHWHGASPGSPMAHVAIAEKDNGKSVDWLEKVSDNDYLAASTSAGLLAPAAGASTPAEQSALAQRSMTKPSNVSETLTARQQAMPLIASFVAVSDMPKLNAALNQGLDAGMTVSETKEILVQLYAYTGFPRSLNALGELLKVVEARKQRGTQDALGREPSRAVATGQALLAIGKENQTKISGGPVQGPVFEFAPVINQFLQAHLFGDIFERDNLDWQSRELATVGALAATPGAEAQLRSHMSAGLRVGLSAAQLRQLTEVLAQRGDPEAAKRAAVALQQALATASKG